EGFERCGVERARERAGGKERCRACDRWSSRFPYLLMLPGFACWRERGLTRYLGGRRHEARPPDWGRASTVTKRVLRRRRRHGGRRPQPKTGLAWTCCEPLPRRTLARAARRPAPARSS